MKSVCLAGCYVNEGRVTASRLNWIVVSGVRLIVLHEFICPNVSALRCNAEGARTWYGRTSVVRLESVLRLIANAPTWNMLIFRANCPWRFCISGSVNLGLVPYGTCVAQLVLNFSIKQKLNFWKVELVGKNFAKTFVISLCSSSICLLVIKR